MNTEEKILQLKNNIIKKLDREIGSKVLLLDCPYHGNVGDNLIWEGEIDFLKETNKKVISQHSLFTFDFPDLSKDVTICLHGGGNFGDLYRAAQDFRIKVINHYPQNKIIIFPQSVFYDDNTLIKKDAEEFSKHNNLLICARDRESFIFLNNNYKGCKIIMVPDMAFCILANKYKRYREIGDKSKLVYFKRLDKEVVNRKNDYLDSLEHKDWKPFEKKYHWSYILKVLGYKSIKINNKLFKKILSRTLDFLMQRYGKARLIHSGLNTLKPYDEIYTTRLHAMILGILMDRKVYGIDGKTNKLSDYYNTWLFDCDKAKMFSN